MKSGRFVYDVLGTGTEVGFYPHYTFIGEDRLIFALGQTRRAAYGLFGYLFNNDPKDPDYHRSYRVVKRWQPAGKRAPAYPDRSWAIGFPKTSPPRECPRFAVRPLVLKPVDFSFLV